MNYLEERLMKLDKLIEQEEKALLHLNKQAGNKVTKIKDLKEERKVVAEQYKNEEIN